MLSSKGVSSQNSDMGTPMVVASSIAPITLKGSPPSTRFLGLPLAHRHRRPQQMPRPSPASQQGCSNTRPPDPLPCPVSGLCLHDANQPILLLLFPPL